MVKKVKYTLLVSLSLFACMSYGQVTVKIDETINEQLRIKNASIDSTKITGYRIQIAFFTDRNQARISENKFTLEFADYNVKTYSLYQQPYWKIRVGDYYHEIDAQQLLVDVRRIFPEAIVVKDYISRPPLKQ
jgi:predicted nucleotidyltransferase